MININFQRKIKSQCLTYIGFLNRNIKLKDSVIFAELAYVLDEVFYSFQLSVNVYLNLLSSC